MDVFEKLELVKDFINEECQRLQNLLPHINNVLSELQDKKCENNAITSAIDVLASTCISVEDANKAFVKDLSSVLSFFKPTVQWHSNKKEMLEMFYLDGNSPWSVWLTYNPSTEIDSLYKNLEQRHSTGLLKKLNNPKVGDYICCYDKKMLFRAVIIEVSSTRIKVINIDRYNIKIIKLDSCYEITQDLCDIHAYSIQCCLTKDRQVEKKWNEDLGRLFQNTLRECRLTVCIVEEIPSLPPLFVVEMYAFNEALEIETNINDWITSRLLPELNYLADNNDQVLDHFSDEALDPFLVCSNLLKSTSETSSLGKNKDNDLTQPVSAAVQNISLEENYREKPRNRLAHLINTDSALTPNKIVSPKLDECVKTDNSNEYLTENTNSNVNFKDSYSSSAIVQYLPENHDDLTKGVSDGSKTNEIFNGSLVNGFYDQVVYEDTMIPNSYLPTDDSRICVFYAKKGFCWKPGCNKQHTKVGRDRWTEDTAEMFTGTINTLNLPAIGCTVTLRVTYIVLCNTFYAQLPDHFSDTGEEGCETAASLNEGLNSAEAKKEFKLLRTPPCFGQLLIAYSSEKSLWLRAVVRDVYDNDILQVFFVDFGVTEELSLNKCREIGPQYVHLPCQAVYCTLANVFAENFNEEEGRLYLESLILDKQLEVQIIDCDIINNRMEILAFLDGININELLINKGYCLSFER